MSEAVEGRPGVIVDSVQFFSEKQVIKLIDQNAKSHSIIVPEGMMGDIVKPLWEEAVEITGFRRGRETRLEDIKRVSMDRRSSGS